jgi:hypothetical protein
VIDFKGTEREPLHVVAEDNAKSVGQLEAMRKAAASTE